MKNYHAILGVSENASIEEIKNAYHALARIYHPDKNTNKETASNFLAIKEAYENLLSNNDNNTNINTTLNEINYQYSIENNLDSFNPTSEEDVFAKIIEELNFSDEIKREMLNLPLENKMNLVEHYLRIKNNLSENDEVKHNEFNYGKNKTFGDIRSINLNYENPFEGLTSKEIKEKLEITTKKYSTIPLQISESAFLWEAKKENYASIYILGTMHLMSHDYLDLFGDVLNNTLQKVHAVFTEIAIQLRDDFNPVAYEVGGKNIFLPDHIIANLARAMRLRLIPLENEFIRNTLDEKNGLDIDYRALIDKLKNSTEELDKFASNHLTHIISSEHQTEDLKARNFFWMENILKQSASQHASLVTCGAMHTVGIYGIPNLLASEGYKLTPLMKKAPTSKRSIIYNLMYGSENSLFFSAAKNKLKNQIEIDHKILPKKNK